MMMIAGCGKGKDQSGLQISDNVEFGKTDYEKITDANNWDKGTWDEGTGTVSQSYFNEFVNVPHGFSPIFEK